MTLQSTLDLLGHHFQQNAEGWQRIANQMRYELAGLDDSAFCRQQPVTKFILTWMRELKALQVSIGQLFGRQKRPSIADDFTASVALCLEQFLSARGFPARVLCEKAARPKRGEQRPDITIWSVPKRLTAAIECKTDFGWDRRFWKEKCLYRASELAKLHPLCSSYLCVLFWDPAEFAHVTGNEQKWFCLASCPPARLCNPIRDTEICNPVEPMFLSILEKLQLDKPAA